MTFTDIDGDIEAQIFGVPAGTNEVVPAGWQLVERVGIIRLGPKMHIHTATHHGALGIVSVGYFKDSAGDWALKVDTDFDEDRELVMGAVALPDYTLVKKRVGVAGASGGGATTLFRIQSAMALSVGTSTTYPANTALPPHSGIFNSLGDNLWVKLTSLRRLV